MKIKHVKMLRYKLKYVVKTVFIWRTKVTLV